MKWHFSYLRHRKGHGIHSPFVYKLITQVLEEKTPYYAFEEIENFRKSLLARTDEIAKITARETQSAKFGKFLFRLENFLQNKNVIVVGASTGVMGMYLAMVSRTQTRCYLLEERTELLQPVKEFALEQHLHNVYFTDADLQQADLIFINQLPANAEIEKIVKKYKSLTHEKTVWIINDIDKNKKMYDLWRSFQIIPGLKLDLKTAGLVFWNNKLPKQTYKLYWKDGKK
ncbi:hypothetical protein FACS1894162_9070 [Bacteroidia bacterium]|nr:hypothetical protein FACS1894162_9070 [Bacteroidia bacterium]